MTAYNTACKSVGISSVIKWRGTDLVVWSINLDLDTIVLYSKGKEMKIKMGQMHILFTKAFYTIYKNYNWFKPA